MSDASLATRRRRRIIAIVIAIVIVIGAAVAIGITRPFQTTAASESSTSAPSETPTPQPTTFATPAAGETAATEKPAPDEPVPFTEPVTTPSDLTVTVDAVTAVTAGTNLPGEISGPAIRVDVTVRNGGADSANLAGSNVTTTYGGDEMIPAISVGDPAAETWPATLAANSAATGVFFFSVPTENAGEVRVIVDLLAAEPDVVFVGSRPE